MNKDFYSKMIETESKATFTLEGAVKRYKRLVRDFQNNPTMEMSAVCCACADVMHNKYGMSWSEIEDVEMSV